MKRNVSRLTLFVILIFCCTIVSSQSLSVESFRLLENDLTANTYGTMEHDQNGEVAALIKVVTSATGFSFDGGMMGIVKTVQKTGEIWVYVPHSIQKITISHQQLGVLRDYYFPISVEKARTYELKLTSGTVRTIIEPVQTSQFVVFKINPQNAVVFIDDDEPYTLDDDGMLSLRLQHGKHIYRVTAASYFPESGVIEVNTEKITKQIDLKSAKAILTVNTESDAEIWIDDKKMGVGKWTGDLAAGVYLVESRKQSHHSVKQEITLTQQEERTISLAAPIPIYGALELSSSPLESNVYLDGVLYGQTPLYIDKLLVGEHSIRLEKSGYLEKTIAVTIVEGKENRQNVSLQKETRTDTNKGVITVNQEKYYDGHKRSAFAVSAGYVNVNMVSDINEYDISDNMHMNGFTVGVDDNINISNNTNVNLGISFDYVISNNGGDYKMTKSELAIPIDFNYKIDLGKDVKLLFYAGPTFNIGLSQKSDYNDIAYDYYESDFSRFELAIGSGTWLDIKKVRFKMGYRIGLTDTYKKDDSIIVNNKKFSVSIGYLF